MRRPRGIACPSFDRLRRLEDLGCHSCRTISPQKTCMGLDAEQATAAETLSRDLGRPAEVTAILRLAPAPASRNGFRMSKYPTEQRPRAPAGSD